jgi:hypothetical protein
MKSLNERWRPVVGWEGWYEVSDLGRVKRVHVGRGGNTHIGRILKGRVGVPGYPEVVLNRKPERRTVLVHRLVADAFVERPDSGVLLEVNHIDGDKTNACATNLEWVTKSKNHQHALRLGLRPVGERHPNAKLSTAAIADIRASYRLRSSAVGGLARKYGVHPATIWKVATRRTRTYE